MEKKKFIITTLQQKLIENYIKKDKKKRKYCCLMLSFDECQNLSDKILLLADWHLDTQLLVPGLGGCLNPGGVILARS